MAMSDKRREQLRIFFEVQDHTVKQELEAELWQELTQAQERIKELEQENKQRERLELSLYIQEYGMG